MTTIPEPVCIQLWSHQGLTPERKAQYDAILANHDEQQPREAPGKNSEEIVPWKSQLESIEHIKALSGELKRFCIHPVGTAKVRSILKDDHILPGLPRGKYAKTITKKIKRAVRKKRKKRSDGLN